MLSPCIHVAFKDFSFAYFVIATPNDSSVTRVPIPIFDHKLLFLKGGTKAKLCKNKREFTKNMVKKIADIGDWIATSAQMIN